MIYVPGTAASFAKSALYYPSSFRTDSTILNGNIKVFLSGLVCYQSVIYCLKAVSNKKFFPAKKARLANLQEAELCLFPLAVPVTDVNEISPDCVTGIYRRVSVGNWSLSHVMISIEAGGICVGSNNACVDPRAAGWSRVDLSQCLVWSAHPYTNPTLVIDGSERLVKIQSISQLLSPL